MIVNTTHIDDVKTKFTELGNAIADASIETDEHFTDTFEALEDFKSIISDVVSDGTIERLRNTVDVIEVHQDKVTGILMDLSQGSNASIMLFNQVLDEAKEKFSQLSQFATGALLNKELEIKEVSSTGMSPEEKSKKQRDEDDDKSDKKKKRGIIRSELKNLGNSIKGMLGRLRLPTKTGMIAATGVMWMGFGFQRRDRIRAEAGEVTNTLVTMFDDGVKGMVGIGTKYISDLQEDLQKFYGIARSEVQGVAKEFADGGFSVSQMLSGVDTDIFKVKDNYLTLTLAIDKMLNIGGGESAKRMVGYMSDYGKTVDEARETTLKLVAAGRDSGIGTMQYIKNVETAADSLKRFGYDIDDVIDLSNTLQEQFEDMGVPKQFAGRQAALGLTQLASGIVSMSNEWKMTIGEEMGYGKGLDAIQKMQEAFTRVAKGGNKGEWIEVIGKLGEVVERAAQGDETLAKYILREASGLNLGTEGANAVMMVKKALDEGDVKKANELVGKNLNILQRSFLTERQKQSQIQRNMNEWMQGISRIGEGIMGILAGLLATIIAYFKSAGKLITNWILDKDEENEKIFTRLDQFSKDMKPSADQIVLGLKDMASAAKKSGQMVLGGAAETLEKALYFNPEVTKKASEADPYKAGMGGLFSSGVGGGAIGAATRLAARGVAGPPGAGGIGRADIPMFGEERPSVPEGTQRVRIITVPIAVGGNEGGTYNVPMAEAYAETAAGAVRLDEEEWIGGGLSIVVNGVDELGNINMMLVGNCPACGLVFGDDTMMSQTKLGLPAYSENDGETLARMIRSEMGRKPITGSRQIEAAGIGYTALNRLRTGKYGKTLEDVITGGHGWGEQGQLRPYATKRKATDESREVARKLLEGRYRDPTGGATHFFHSTGGKGYGSKKHEELRTALPRFTENKVNTLNINRASFWGGKRQVSQEAADTAKLRDREERMFAKKRGLTPMTDVHAHEQEKKSKREQYPSVFNLGKEKS